MVRPERVRTSIDFSPPSGRGPSSVPRQPRTTQSFPRQPLRGAQSNAPRTGEDISSGHGGNELKPLTRELHHRTDVFLCVCDWYRVATDQYKDLFDRPGEHADEVETSLGLAFFPHLVRPELADDGAARPTKFEAVNRG